MSSSGVYLWVFTGALRSLLLFTDFTEHYWPLTDIMWMVFWPGLYVFVVLLDVLHQFVMMAIAELSPLFSWLKDAPPGTYLSSYQQKKQKNMFHEHDALCFVKGWSVCTGKPKRLPVLEKFSFMCIFGASWSPDTAIQVICIVRWHLLQVVDFIHWMFCHLFPLM